MTRILLIFVTITFRRIIIIRLVVDIIPNNISSRNKTFFHWNHLKDGNVSFQKDDFISPIQMQIQLNFFWKNLQKKRRKNILLTPDVYSSAHLILFKYLESFDCLSKQIKDIHWNGSRDQLWNIAVNMLSTWIFYSKS